MESELEKESKSNCESESEIQSPNRRVAVRVTDRELESDQSVKRVGTGESALKSESWSPSHSQRVKVVEMESV